MNKKICISENQKKQVEFQLAVESAQSESNRLIELFHSFQPYLRIERIEDWELLVRNPLAFYDEALQVNVNFQESGGKKGNPKIIADLFDLDRDTWISLVKGEKIDPSSCKSCGGSSRLIKSGQPVINYNAYKMYESYLNFDNGRFTIDEDAVAIRSESFKIYAETEQAIQCWEYWQSVIKMLNSLNTYCSLKALQDLMNGRVVYLYDSNRLVLNEEQVINEVINLNK